MARPSQSIIQLLRTTAARLEAGSNYEWAHAGRCNCGHLVQNLTGLSAQAINAKARDTGLDEWSEFANDYCPTSGHAVDDIIRTVLDAGFELKDIHHLEYLSNATILRALPGGFRYLKRNCREDVAIYLRTWAGLLEVKSAEKKRAPAPPVPA